MPTHKFDTTILNPLHRQKFHCLQNSSFQGFARSALQLIVSMHEGISVENLILPIVCCSICHLIINFVCTKSLILNSKYIYIFLNYFSLFGHMRFSTSMFLVQVVLMHTLCVFFWYLLESCLYLNCIQHHYHGLQLSFETVKTHVCLKY